MLYGSLIVRKGSTPHLNPYSIGTAITAFSLVMTGWFTGFLQEYVGYRLFFLLVAMLGVISFIVTYFLPVTKEIGKRKKDGLNPFKTTVLMFCFQPLTFIKKS